MKRSKKICVRCVMDESDPLITFDGSGICNHCHAYDRAKQAVLTDGARKQDCLNKEVEQLKRDGRDRDYDCVIGVSGGVDSTYVAWKAKQLGLRPLAVHLDNGWNSELAVHNIQAALSRLDVDLMTHVIDWDEFKDLQLSFLKASTPDGEIPTDHAIVAFMYRTALKYRIPNIIFGYNNQTESHLTPAWSQGHHDWKYIRSVHRQFGRRPLKTFPHFTWMQLRQYESRFRQCRLLELVDYRKEDAIRILTDQLGWRSYGAKHHESIYTRFYQGHVLVKKFGFDKRRCHLSSLICSGETTRESALSELQHPPYSPSLQEEDRLYVMKKLGVTEPEWEQIMRQAPKTYWDYPSYGKMVRHPLYRTARTVYRWIKRQSDPA